MKTLYLVTGATGHLGMNLVMELVKRQYAVRALVLANDKHIDKLPPSVQVTIGNILNLDSLESFFDNPDFDELIVIHCAGIVTTYSQFNQLAYDVNVNGTKNIIQMCLKHPVKKLIYISSVHALVELAHGQTIVENSSFNPDSIIGFYGKTKAEASQAVMDAVKNHDLDASLIFPSGIIGPNDYFFGHTTQLIMDAANNKMNVWIKGGFDFVDVRDVANGIIDCSIKGEKGQGYLLSNVYTTFRDLMKLIDLSSHRKPVRIFIPRFLITLGIPFMHIYYKLLKRKPLLTTYSLYTINSNSQLSSAKAQMQFQYKTRPFAQTIDDTVQWLATIHKIKQINSNTK